MSVFNRNKPVMSKIRMVAGEPSVTLSPSDSYGERVRYSILEYQITKEYFKIKLHNLIESK